MIRFVVARIKRRITKKIVELAAEELIEAEDIFIKDVQTNVFSEEIKQITKGTKTPNSRLNQLRLFLEERGIIRCEGRIENSEVLPDAKKLILLPAKHHVTDLIIQEKIMTQKIIRILRGH